MASQELPFNLEDGAENGLINFTADISSGYSATSSTLKASGNYAFHLAQPLPTDQFLTLDYNLLAQSNSAVQFMSLLGYATPSQVAEVQVSTNSGNSWQDVYSQPGSTPESVFSAHTVSLSNFAGNVIQVRFDYSYQGGSYYPQTGDYDGWFLDNISFTNFQVLTNQARSAISTETNFDFIPAEAGNYILTVRAIAYGPSDLAFGPLLFVTAAANPVLAYSVSGGKLMLSWSDPAFSLQQTPTLSPASWSSVTGGSPVSVPLPSPSNLFFRLIK